jgi:hypothetical protein
MALTILTGSSQAAGVNYSYRTSGSADWSSVPTASYFYDQVDKITRYKMPNGDIVNSISSSYAVTASFALNGGGGSTNTGSLLTTASVSLNTITFTKGDGSTFPITVDTGSGGPGVSDFPYTGSATITGSLVITGSILVTQSYISTVDYIDFTVLPAEPAFNTGRLHWTDDTKTLQLDTDVNNFELEIGHQSVIRGRNVNSFTLTKGSVVYISGESGNRPTFATASWTDDSSSATTIGIIAQDINSSQTGYAVTNGLIRDVNTNAFPPGTSLYLSSSGQYTDTPPSSPLHEVRLGKTITQATNGIIYIDIQNGYEIGELHDVLITSASTGDLLVWNSGSQIWENTKQLTGSYGLTGSLTATSFTGSLLGTASYATQALSSSFALTASYAPPTFPYTGSAIVSGSVDITGSLSVLDSNNVNVLNTNTYILRGAGPGNISVDWSTRTLNDPSSTPVVDWRNLILRDASTSGSINWSSRRLSNSAGTMTADWQNLRLIDSATSSSINWSDRALVNVAQGTTVDWENLTLKKAAATVVDWANYRLIRTTTKLDWNLGELYDTSTTQSINWQNRYNIDATGILATNWDSRRHFDASTSSSINWNARALSDGLEVTAVDWGVRQAYDESGTLSLDWNSRNVTDTAGTPSIEWQSRALIDQNGGGAISWDGLNNSYNIINYYPQITTLPIPTLDAFSDATPATPITQNFSGEQIGADNLVDAGVSIGNLVYLNSDGFWYKTNQTSASSSYMLGICLENDPSKETILTEGNIGFTTASVANSPLVTGTNFYGVPIYISGSNGAMSTDKPTSGIVRIVGHAFYNSTTNPSNWIMKFRPSNDWYEI